MVDIKLFASTKHYKVVKWYGPAHAGWRGRSARRRLAAGGMFLARKQSARIGELYLEKSPRMGARDVYDILITQVFNMSCLPITLEIAQAFRRSVLLSYQKISH
jgi:hypothetical protein